MNKAFLLLATLTLLAFSACKEASTEPDPTSDAEGVEGSWDFISLDQTNGENKLDGNLIATFHSESSNEQGTYTFGADGTYTGAVSYTNTLTMTIFGVEQTQVQEIPMTSINGNYVFDENAMVLTISQNSGESLAYDITELTANRMVMEADYYQEQVEMGIVSSTSTHFIVTLAR